MRYEVLGRDAAKLKVLCIEEESYAPGKWYSVEYTCASESICPDPQDICVRAQVLAFCRSYLARFAPQNSERA